MQQNKSKSSEKLLWISYQSFATRNVPTVVWYSQLSSSREQFCVSRGKLLKSIEQSAVTVILKHSLQLKKHPHKSSNSASATVFIGNVIFELNCVHSSQSRCQKGYKTKLLDWFLTVKMVDVDMNWLVHSVTVFDRALCPQQAVKDDAILLTSVAEMDMINIVWKLLIFLSGSAC